MAKKKLIHESKRRKNEEEPGGEREEVIKQMTLRQPVPGFRVTESKMTVTAYLHPVLQFYETDSVT